MTTPELREPRHGPMQNGVPVLPTIRLRARPEFSTGGLPTIPEETEETIDEDVPPFVLNDEPSETYPNDGEEGELQNRIPETYSGEEEPDR